MPCSLLDPTPLPGGENVELKAGKSTFAPMTINLSSQSTATNMRGVIESFLLKRRTGVLGPPLGKVSFGLCQWHWRGREGGEVRAMLATAGTAGNQKRECGAGFAWRVNGRWA